jgi:hypothetical protein
MSSHRVMVWQYAYATLVLWKGTLDQWEGVRHRGRNPLYISIIAGLSGGLG